MDIFQAIVNNDINRVKELLNSGVDVNATNRIQATPLMDAIYYGKYKIAKLLLQHPDIDVNKKEGSSTALDMAMYKEKFDLIELLLSRPDIDLSSQPYLHKAINKKANFDIFNLLLSRSEIDINEKYGMENNTVLHKSFKEIEFSSSWIELLLTHPDIDINAKNSSNKTLLNLACESIKPSSYRIVKLLLSRSEIDVNNKNNLGNTPLISISMYGYSHDVLEIVELLLAHPNIDINAKNNKDKTALNIIMESLISSMKMGSLLSNNSIHLDSLLVLLENPKIEVDFNYQPYIKFNKNNLKLIGLFKKRSVFPKKINTILNTIEE